jgi:hypothetical protein
MSNEIIYEMRGLKSEGKWWGYGRVTKNQKGTLQAGMRKTPDLIALFNSVPEGGYLNFVLSTPFKQNEPRSAAAKSVPPELNDEIPF